MAGKHSRPGQLLLLQSPVSNSHSNEILHSACCQATNLLGNKRKRGLRILLAEDDRISQTIAVAVLESQGWEVTAVVNGQEVLDELEINHHDLILMDVQMPEMNGFETTRKIRVHSNRKTSKIPIIAMTAHAVRGDREKCLAAGMNGYLSKPIETKIFMEVIDKILSNSAPI
jgi:CheY-like chemotaxis protein